MSEVTVQETEVVVTVGDAVPSIVTIPSASSFTVSVGAGRGETGAKGDKGDTDFGDIALGNYTAFDETSGHQTMFGDARNWRDEVGDALSLRVQGTGLSANFTEATVEFSSASDLNDFLYKNVQLNHDRDEDTIIYPHIHYLQASGVVPNFLLRYRWQVNGGTKNGSWTDLACKTSAFTYVSGTLHQIAATVSGITPPVNSTLSDIVQFKILRDNANASGKFSGADTYPGAVGVLSFDVHVQANSIGSGSEYTK